MRFRRAAHLTVTLYRTQEVGGSNPPSSIDSNLLQPGHFGFRGAVPTGRKFLLVSGTSAQTPLDMRGYASIPGDYGLPEAQAIGITDQATCHHEAPLHDHRLRELSDHLDQAKRRWSEVNDRKELLLKPVAAGRDAIEQATDRTRT